MSNQKELGLVYSTLEAKLSRLLSAANLFLRQGRPDQSLQLAHRAWRQLPAPATQWSLSYGISDTLSRSYISLRDFDSALHWTVIAKACKPQLCARDIVDVGTAYFELKLFIEAYDYFDRAYALDGQSAFEGCHGKYLSFYLSNIHASANMAHKRSASASPH